MSGSKDFVYGKGRKALNSGQIDWLTASVQAMLVSAVYAPQPNTDQYVSDIPSAAVIIRDVALTGLGISNAGVCFGTIPQFVALTATAPVAAVVLYANSGTDSSSPLIYYSSSGSGFPFLPQGFTYVIGYDQANGGFFQ